MLPRKSTGNPHFLGQRVRDTLQNLRVSPCQACFFCRMFSAKNRRSDGAFPLMLPTSVNGVPEGWGESAELWRRKFRISHRKVPHFLQETSDVSDGGFRTSPFTVFAMAFGVSGVPFSDVQSLPSRCPFFSVLMSMPFCPDLQSLPSRYEECPSPMSEAPLPLCRCRLGLPLCKSSISCGERECCSV